MNLQTLIRSLFGAAQSMLYIQSICFLTTLPILYFWEIPFSGAAIACNIIFAPVMMLFILLSIIFTTIGTLLPDFFCHAFSTSIHFWLKTMGLISAKWLFMPNQVIIGLWIASLLVIKITAAFNEKLLKRSIIVSAIGLNLMAVGQAELSADTEFVVSSKHGSIKVIKKNGITTAFDSGFLSNGKREINCQQLRKQLIKNCRSGKLNSLTLGSCSPKTLAHTKTSTMLMDIETIKLKKKCKQSPSRNAFKKFAKALAKTSASVCSQT